jgi:ubiquinone/menaquinone biosynthesis C-methylase UbiE
MDYDATSLPAGYDLARGHPPDTLKLWMDTIAGCAPGCRIATILDLGCGTGRFSHVLGSHFDADVIGVDPSVRMLEQARAKPVSSRVRYELGEGEAIPLPDQSVDLAFMSMVFHHFKSPALVARECRRVLRDGGLVFLRAGTAEQISSYAYVDFFPTSVPILKRTLARGQDIQAVFEAAGFHTLRVGVLMQTIASTHAAYADRIAAGGDSVLAQLSPLEFEAGLRALRSHAARIDPKSVSEPIDFFAFACYASQRAGRAVAADRR